MEFWECCVNKRLEHYFVIYLFSWVCLCSVLSLERTHFCGRSRHTQLKIMPIAWFHLFTPNFKSVFIPRRNKAKQNKREMGIMHQSIPAAPSWPPPPTPLPRADPQALAFFCLGWQIPGGGEYWVVKSPGVGTKKEDKCPVLRQHCNIFHLLHSRIVPF